MSKEVSEWLYHVAKLTVKIIKHESMKQKASKNLQMLVFVMKIYRRNIPTTYREIVQNKLKAKVMYDSKSDRSIFMGLIR